MNSGVNHITLSVRDVDRSFGFYVETLGAKPLARWSKGA
jgi:glutathione S-transferase fosA5